ncbi:MAG: hypothetical protein ACI8PT_003159 [Gammaproteobacteria bacterium]|jgi:uncharacterized protein (PEP-CTERM system associated)
MDMVTAQANREPRRKPVGEHCVAVTLVVRWLGTGILLAASTLAVAGDWTITPRASLSETYTDNVGLAADGTQRDDFVTDATGGLSVHGSGRRLKLNADYNLQKLLHQSDASPDSTRQQWQVDADAELVDKIAFVNMRTTMSQLNGSNSGRVSDSAINSGSQTDVLTFALAPSVKHRFGRYAESSFELSYDYVNNDSGTTDTTTESYGTNTELRSGSRFSRVPWSLSLSQRTVTNSDESESKFGSIDARTSYVFSRKYKIDFGAGYDRNEFTSQNTQTKGARWSAGATWSPSPRTTILGGFERRFFDNAFFFDLNHKSRRTRWTASYREDISTSRDLQLQRVLVALEDPFGDSLVDPVSGDPIIIPVNFVVPTDEVLVSRDFSGTAQFSGRRMSASATVFRSSRTFQATGDQESQLGASVRVSRDMSRHVTASSSVGWQLTEPRAGAGASVADETRWTFDASMSYVVNDMASGRLSYRYTKQADDGGISDFAENRLTAALNLRF